VKLAKKEFRPDLALEAGYMNRGGLDPMWQAGVGLSLPLYRTRPRSGVSEAQARVRASERGAQAVQLLLRFRTQERVAQIKTTERIAGLYGQSIIPQDQLSVDAAISNYQVGKIPFVTVLEALSTLYSDRSTYLGLLSNHAMLRANLEEASLEAGPAMPGGLPNAVGTTGGAGSDAQMGGGMR
jgi:outer membrane protein TolC